MCERERDRETDRQTHSHTHTHTHTQKLIWKLVWKIQKGIDRREHTDRDSQTDTNTHTHAHTHEKERRRSGETERRRERENEAMRVRLRDIEESLRPPPRIWSDQGRHFTCTFVEHFCRTSPAGRGQGATAPLPESIESAADVPEDGPDVDPVLSAPRVPGGLWPGSRDLVPGAPTAGGGDGGISCV